MTDKQQASNRAALAATLRKVETEGWTPLASQRREGGRNMRSDSLVDVDCEVRKETPTQIAVWAGAKDKQGKEVWAWLPRSQCEIDDAAGTVTMPEWLAIDRGLV